MSYIPKKIMNIFGGLMMSGNLEGMLTCTPEACLQLIKKSGVIIQVKKYTKVLEPL